MTGPSNVEVVRRLFEAVEHRDFEGVLACYAPDVEIYESPALPYGGVFAGEDGVRRHAAAFMRAWGRLQPPGQAGMAPRLAELDDETVVVVFTHRAADPETGRQLQTPEIGLYTLRDGRVRRSQMFHFDPTELARFADRGQWS
jgi:ketosteroid isomerase-like protein